MANRYPLVFDKLDGNKIKELPDGDNLNLQGSSIVDAVNITATGTIQADTLTVTNINASGGSIANVAISGNYNDLINKPNIFSGDYNDLVNKPVLFSGNYNDLSNKPSIPSRTSQLINDANFVTNITATVTASNVDGLATVAVTNDFADLDNVPDYITRAEVAGGSLTIEVKNTGDLVGSVFGSDSTLLVDHLNSTIPASVISGVGNFNLNVTSGTTTLDNVNVTDFSAVRSSISILTTGELSLEGHLVSEDSSTLIDSVTRTHFGTFDGTIAKTGPILNITSQSGIQMSPSGAFNIPNATTLTLTASSTASVTSNGNLTLTSSSGNIVIVGNVPASSIGANGDVEGSVAFDSGYIYYCTADYDSVTNVWKRVAWSGDTW